MNFAIKNLGPCTIESPQVSEYPIHESSFVTDDIEVSYHVIKGKKPEPGINIDDSFEMAGPRKKIYFNPSKIKSAIVTCGGLCPGINDVIRSIVMTSNFDYGSKSITGIRYGYNGLNPKNNYKPVNLTLESVEDIHHHGGTILASSRGGTDDMDLLVNTLEKMGINILYCIGGDGTLHGAHRIAEIALERGIPLSVVGVPKTIDNDISYIQRSFGFETAFSEAVKAITTAHIEAKGAPNGIGLVKLMGRHSGYIAANASLAMNDVNFIMVPEVPFELYGDNGFLKHLEKRILERHHAVICVAEGAGQNLMEDHDITKHDASGNVKLDDIGIFIKERIKTYFKERNLEANIKYIDPSYMIRSAPANPNDSLFCQQLGELAVHGAMAGKTDMAIGLWNNIYTHVPIELAISKRKQIDPNSRFWSSVLNATGQPLSMVN